MVLYVHPKSKSRLAQEITKPEENIQKLKAEKNRLKLEQTLWSSYEYEMSNLITPTPLYNPQTNISSSFIH